MDKYKYLVVRFFCNYVEEIVFRCNTIEKAKEKCDDFNRNNKCKNVDYRILSNGGNNTYK
jgi:hypothetical protein|nr:MAG TPA: hypothetical protein [Caudoviricetes sp.]